MRRKISLYIADRLVDLDDDSLILFNYTMEDLKNPVIVKNSYSQQVTIPGTPANNGIFGRYQRLDRISGTGFNAMERMPFKIYNELDEVLVSGYAKLDSVQRRGRTVHSFRVTLYGSLGSYFYDLSLRADGTAANLGDLSYRDASGNLVKPNDQTFALTALTIRNMWLSLQNGQTGLLQSPWWNFFNFAPCLNGVPADFDARKALVTSGIYLGIVPSGEDGAVDNPHPDANDSYLVTMETDKTESEVRDYRAYLQRPVINVAAFMGALVDRGNFHVSQTVLDLIGSDVWVTLPLPRRTGSYAVYPMRNFFEGSIGPADLLISIAKRFGLVFVSELDGIHLESRDEFYQGGSTIDIERRIDRDSIEINPMSFTNRWYLWQDEVAGEFADTYRDTWGKTYGEQKVNTGYDFDNGSRVVTDTLKTRGAAQVLDQSRMYVASWTSAASYFPASRFENVSFQGYDESGDESSTIDLKQYLPLWVNEVFYNSAHHYYNVISMPQFQDKDRKPVDGGGVLLYLDSFVALPQAKDALLRDKILWRLTDDDDDLFALLNSGKPCWDMRDSSGTTFAFMPHFSRWKDTESLEFGSPLELGEFLPSYPSNTVYERFWRDYIADRYDKDTTVVRCKVDLKGMQVGQALLRNFFWFDNCIWVLNRIGNYSLTTYDSVECEFVKVHDKTAYTSGIGDYLNISPSSVSTTSTGGTVTVTVVSNLDWTATSDSAWAVASPSSGSGDGTVTLTLGANTGAARSALVTISAEGVSKTVSIAQSSAEQGGLTVYPESFACELEGAYRTIDIRTGGAWEITSPNAFVGGIENIDQEHFIEIMTPSGTGNASADVWIWPARDAGGNLLPGVGEIIVTGGGTSKTISVKKGSSVSITVNGESAVYDSMPAAGGEYAVTLAYTQGATVTVSKSQSWASVAPDNSQVHIGANTGSMRTVTIWFTATLDGEEATASLTIYQAGV